MGVTDLLFTAEYQKKKSLFVFLYFKFLERDGNRGPWPASVILIGLDWIGLEAVKPMTNGKKKSNSEDRSDVPQLFAEHGAAREGGGWLTGRPSERPCTDVRTILLSVVGGRENGRCICPCVGRSVGRFCAWASSERDTESAPAGDARSIN